MRALGKFWLCAVTKFSEERRAASHVERQSHEFYLPEMPVKDETGRMRRRLMFPGYIFIYIRDGRWTHLSSTRGIQRVLSHEETPVRVPRHEIQWLKSREDEDGLVRLNPRPHVGDTVTVSSGGFAGIAGVVQNLLPSDRCKVMFRLLGRSVVGEFDDGALRVA